MLLLEAHLGLEVGDHWYSGVVSSALALTSVRALPAWLLVSLMCEGNAYALLRRPTGSTPACGRGVGVGAGGGRRYEIGDGNLECPPLPGGRVVVQHKHKHRGIEFGAGREQLCCIRSIRGLTEA